MDNRLNITFDDVLHAESYYEFCDYPFLDKDDQDLPSGIINCDIQGAKALLERVKEYPDRKYIIVSSRCDFGLAYQKEFPVWRDMVRWVELMTKPELGYNDIKVEARVDKTKCDINDNYSVRCYSKTSHTFNEIPHNVLKWWMVNCHIMYDNHLIGIPFGLNVCDGDKSGIEGIFNHKYNGPRNKLIYLNYSMNTFDRVKLKVFYRHYDYVTIKDNIKQQEYLDDLASHMFCLCPAGNGIDCYRIWECLYMGCIPIVEISEVSNHLTDLNLPILSVHTLINLNPNELYEIYQRFIKNYDKFNWDALRASYWKNLIQKDRNLLND